MGVNIARIKDMTAAEAKDALVSARQSISRMRGEAKAITERGMVAAAGNGGAALAGVAKGLGLETVADIPVVAVGGALVEAAGILGMGGSEVANFSLICFGSSASAPFLADTVADLLK